MPASTIHPNPQRKKKIPKALREALWIFFHKGQFEAKCHTNWCPNRITAYDFQAGHNIPESKGGATTLENLVPICQRCNLSMSNIYTFDEWQVMGMYYPQPIVKRHWFYRYVCCLC